MQIDLSSLLASRQPVSLEPQRAELWPSLVVLRLGWLAWPARCPLRAGLQLVEWRQVVELQTSVGLR